MRLRGLTEADLPRVVEQCRDADAVRFTTVPADYGPQQATEFLAAVRAGWAEPGAGAARTWAIDVATEALPQLTPADPVGRWRFAGTVAVRPQGPGIADIGYLVHPGCRGQGVATRAVRLLMEHVFADESLELLTWRAAVGNWASRRVAWACGFRVEGPHRGLLEHRGSLLDGWSAVLHRDDPRRPPHPWRRPPTMHADGVELRAWQAGDGHRLPTERDDLAARFLGDIIPTRDSFDQWWASALEAEAMGDRVSWCLTDPVGGAILGGILVFRLADPRSPQGRLGYWLLPAARGRGVAARATRAVLGWAFAAPSAGGLGLVAVSADADVANAASIRVLHRAGFRDVGIRRAAGLRPDGTVVDLLEVDLLGTELPQSRAVSAPAGPSPR